MNRPPFFLWCAVLGALALPSVAQAQIYRCEGADGVVEYSNNPASGRDAKCRPLDLPSITTVPAPKLPAQPARPASASSSPAAFPRVDSAAQRNRDQERRRILEDELRKEEGRLAELRTEYNGGEPDRRGDERNYQKYLDRVQRLKDDIARTESSIASIKREIATVRE